MNRSSLTAALVALALVAAALFLSACSGSDAPGASSSDGDAGGLVLGHPAGFGDGGQGGGPDGVEDLASDCPGGPFCPCAEHGECDSGLCIPGPSGSLCAKNCVQTCPAGYACRLVGVPGGSDPLNICVPRWGRLCDPCATDKDCGALGVPDAACVDMGEQGAYCSVPCHGEGCPGGYICKTTFSTAGGKAERCVPAPGIGRTYGTCACSPSAIAARLETACWIEAKDEQGAAIGQCRGRRRCEEAGLTACLAAPASEEVCDGEDNDCDGQTDEIACDDDNACTRDFCDPKRTIDGGQGCVHQFTEAPCDADGDACTDNDRCAEGVCRAGEAKDCDDGNVCTADHCLPATGCTQTDDDGAPCDDDNPCTMSDLCHGGGCDPGASKKCKSGNPCMLAACSTTTGKCGFKPMPDGVPCDDGTACTKSDACLTGTCLGKVVDCDDGNPCTDDGCDPAAGCASEPNTQPCTDADHCTTGDVCKDGKCRGAAVDPAIDCQDDNACTKEACDPKKGCVHAAVQGDCSDGNPCTAGDSCVAGSCAPGKNTCQCESAADCKPFEDGDACNGTLFCDKKTLPYTCAIDPKTVVHCGGAGDTACLGKICDKSKGVCKLLPKSDGKACDADGDVCTVGDRCAAGNCVPGPQKNCDDDESCTADSCDRLKGCVHPAGPGSCEDGDGCTVGDHCQHKVCVPGHRTTCDDGHKCTADGCDKATGKCVFAGIPGCGGYCATAADCDDNRVCTSDLCVQGRCLISPNTKACNDGDKCTVADTCKDAQCRGTKRNCDDANACTTDACKGGLGCVHQAHDLGCEDGDKCTSGDQCSGGACKSGGIQNCDDGDKCTTDACAPGTGKCAHQPILGCGGHCAEAGHCDDRNVCTDDKCLMAAGARAGMCAHSHNKAKCDDGNACTTSDHCEAGRCVGGGGIALGTFAGSGIKGYKDDNPKVAQFDSPAGLAAFGGNLFVADRGNHAIRRIAPDGLVFTHAGSGSAGYKDGFGKLAAFSSPRDLAADKAGNLYVADSGNHLIRRVTQQGAVTTLAGSGKPGHADGIGVAASFYSPRGIAVTPLGAVFVADWQNNRVRMVAPGGKVSTLAGSGVPVSKDGKGSAAGVVRPLAIAVSAGGKLYFTEGSPSSRVRRVTLQGVVTTLAGGGDGLLDGSATQARFHNPAGIAIDSAGSLLVADRSNHRIRRVGTTGFVTTLIGYAGFGYQDGDPSGAKVDLPTGLAVDVHGRLFVADSGNHRLRRLVDSKSNCNIGGACYGPGLRKPGSPCMVCDPSKNKAAWTALPAGTLCEDGDLCTVQEKCTTQAGCSGKSPSCDDGDPCTIDSCDGATGACRHAEQGGGCG